MVGSGVDLSVDDLGRLTQSLRRRSKGPYCADGADMQGDDESPNESKINQTVEGERRATGLEGSTVEPQPVESQDLDGKNEPSGESAMPSAASDNSARANTCAVCRQPLSRIFLNVDGNTLIMESCDGCDLRRWQLAGKRIELKRALEEVEEHVSRARN